MGASGAEPSRKPAGEQSGGQSDNAAARCERAAQASEWESAVGECEGALREFPESFGIHYLLGFAHEALESWPEAAEAFEAFLREAEAAEDAETRLGEQIARAVRSAALARSRVGPPESALSLLQRAADSDPADSEVAFHLGLARLAAGDSTAAEEAFAVVIREAPEVPEARFFAGRIRYRAGDYEAAAEHLRRFLADAPESPLAADALWMTASVAMRASAAAEAESAESRAESGAAEAARREAVTRFGEFLDLEGGSDRSALAHYFLGAFAADDDDCAGAALHYRRFLELAPDHERAEEVRRYLEETAPTCAPDPGTRAHGGPGW